MTQHHPDLPASLAPPEDLLDLEQIWYDVCEELLDTKFTGRTHHHRRTYDAGCAGPLCKKAVREFSRRRATTTAPRIKFQHLDPILDFFFPIAEELIEDAYRDILKTLTRAS